MSDDPGGVFASDAHRRVLAHLPIPSQDPMDSETFLSRVASDDGYEYVADEVQDVLLDLEADGHASELKDGWRQTKKGLEALQAPVKEG